jgi:hypothetical protein
MNQVDIGKPAFDIDFYNIEMIVSWLATLSGMLRFTSNAQHHRKLSLGSKPSAKIGVVGAVQLIDEPPIFIPQGVHQQLIDALCAVGIVVRKPPYKPFDYRAASEDDPDDRDGDRNMAPVAFSITTAYATGPTLHAALVRIGVRSVRTQRYNCKTPIQEWICMFAQHMVTGEQTKNAFDISGVSQVGDGSCIPLIKVLAGRRHSTMEMCGAIGLGAGTLFMDPILVGEQTGVRVDALVGYACGLVHQLKARGFKGDVGACGTVRTAADLRRRTVAFLNSWIDELEGDKVPPLGFLRFEVRVVVDHALFRGSWRDLVDLVGVGGFEEAERLYASKALKLACVLISRQDYIAALRESIARLNQPKYRVGFTLNSEDEMSINAVKCRFADINAQAGLHPGMRIRNCVNRSAVLLSLDPSVEEVDAGGSIFDASFKYVEPQLPPPPARVAAAPRKRAFVLVVGDDFKVPAAQAYIKQITARQNLEQFGYEDVPEVPHIAVDHLRRTIEPARPAGRLIAMFGEASQQEFRAAHPEMSRGNALRLQILATINIVPRGRHKFVVKRKGQFVAGCSANSIELLLDYLVTNHPNDWNTFDKKPNLIVSEAAPERPPENLF